MKRFSPLRSSTLSSRSTGALQAVHSRRTRRWASTPFTEFFVGWAPPRVGIPLNTNRCSLVADGGASFAVDDATGERREGDYEDWLQATRMIDALDDVGVYWSMVDPGFFQSTIGGYTGYITQTFRNFSKHVQEVTHTVVDSRCLWEVMDVVFGGSENIRKTKPFSYLVTPISPMVLEAEHTDAYLELSGKGIPLAIIPMPMLGGTAPAS